MTDIALTPDALKAIKSLCQRYQVRELSVFGSALREDFRTDSDVDLLVEFEPEAQIGFVTLVRMQRELSAILNRPVDLVPEEGLKPAIREEVIASAREVYAA